MQDPQGSIPGLGRSPGGGHGNPLQYSCWDNPLDRGAWWAIVHRIAKSQAPLTRIQHLGRRGHRARDGLVHSSLIGWGHRARDQLVHSSLIGWWQGCRCCHGVNIIHPWAPGVLGLCAQGPQVVNVLHLVGVFHICEITQEMSIKYSYLGTSGSLRVGCNWATSLSLFTFMHWRRKWQPTPVFLPGESQEWGNLVGCSLWGRTESDTTEAT